MSKGCIAPLGFALLLTGPCLARSRLESTSPRSSVKEAARLVEVLAENIAPDRSIPRAWHDLPKIGELKKTGRARCFAMPCGGVRLYRDQRDNLWLTFASGFNAGPLPPDIGAAMVALDSNAAQFDTNVWG